MKIACVGDVTIDKYTNGNNFAGGMSFNISKILKRINPSLNVSLISAIGNDEYGKFLKKKIIESNVTPILQEIEGISSQIEIKLVNSERHFQNYNAGVLERFDLNEEQIKVLEESDVTTYACFKELEHILIKSLPYAGNSLKVADFADLVDYGKDLSIVEKTIKNLDILFFGLEKLDEKTIKDLERMASKHNKLIIITLGKDGALAFFKNKKIEVPAEKVTNIVDTTGAGDTFIASFLISYIKNKNVNLSLKEASEEASKTIQRIGVI